MSTPLTLEGVAEIVADPGRVYGFNGGTGMEFAIAPLRCIDCKWPSVDLLNRLKFKLNCSRFNKSTDGHLQSV